MPSGAVFAVQFHGAVPLSGVARVAALPGASRRGWPFGLGLTHLLALGLGLFGCCLGGHGVDSHPTFMGVICGGIR
jgi:hypothetical protein